MDAELAALVGRHAGKILEEERTERGSMSDYTGVVRTAGGIAFVKAVRTSAIGRVRSLQRETAINPYVRQLSASLLWQDRSDNWAMAGFEFLRDVRTSSFKPGSPDLRLVAGAVERIGHIRLPDMVRDWPETRYDQYALNGDAELFQGDSLVHSDINPSNFLIGPSGSVSVVDWAWPVKGAAWLDAACMTVQLIAAGHTPEQAEEWAAHCTAWQKADQMALDAFSRTLVRMYAAIEERNPVPWRTAMTQAAQAWHRHRTR